MKTLRIKPLDYLLVFLLVTTLHSCYVPNHKPAEKEGIDYKEEMRDFVLEISNHAKRMNPNFKIIPQNATALITRESTLNGNLHYNYISAIDGHGLESLFYGFYDDDEMTPEKVTNYTSGLLNRSKDNGKQIFVIDYCNSEENIEDSYTKNNNYGYAVFAATERNLNNIPNVYINNENSEDVIELSDAKNFIPLLNTENFATKEEFISTLENTNYDMLIIDAYFKDGTSYTKDELNRLKLKANGGKRLVISYISIGEAEDYRYYWDKDWVFFKPDWISYENPDWEGNYVINYWEKSWQDIIINNEDGYLKTIVKNGFDGAYLDRVDAYHYFE